jgi:hypothetical protein
MYTYCSSESAKCDSAASMLFCAVSEYVTSSTTVDVRVYTASLLAVVCRATFSA